MRGQHAILRVHEVERGQGGKFGSGHADAGLEGARRWHISAYLPQGMRSIRRVVEAPPAVSSASPRDEVKGTLAQLLAPWLEDAPCDSEARELAAAVRAAGRELKAQGDRAFGEGDHAGAEALYRKGLQRWPGNVMARLSLAAAQVAQGKLRAAAWECKRVVAAVRAEEVGDGEGAGAADGGDCGPGGVGPEGSGWRGEVAAKAYARLARVYTEQKRWVRAGNALVLALRSATPGSGCDPLPPPPEQTPLQRQLVRQLKRLPAQGGGAGEGRGGDRGEGAPRGARVPDIEDAVSSHWLLKRSDPFSFACTGCGECCRTSDHILLSPYDLWRMTRSPDAHLLLGTPATTTALTRRFSGALHFSSQHGVPVCSLRPRKEASGRCAFSFPLWEVQDGGDGVAPRVLSFREAFHEGLVKEEEEEEEEPVHPSEYTLTEEDLAAEQSDSSGDDGENADVDEVEDEEEGDGASEGSEELRDLVPEAASDEGDDTSDAGPQMRARRKRAGRQALGCSLGAAGMPAMCASYPMARELSWADFWHAHERGTAARSRMVVVHNAACEGFRAGAAAEAAAVFGAGRAPLVAGAASSERPPESAAGEAGAEEAGREAEESGTRTVTDFVRRNGLDARWDENERFFARCLRPAASSPGVQEAARGDGERQRVVWAALAQVWYDFDKPAGPAGKGPAAGTCASWPAMRRHIEERTQEVLAAVGGMRGAHVYELTGSPGACSL